MSKKKKIIFLSCMVVLIVAAAVCNILISNKLNASNDDADPAMSTTDFFAYYRLERESLRNENATMLSAVISDANADANSKSVATAALIALEDASELELMLESLIRAQGVSDVCVSTNASSQYINVIVADEIDEEMAEIIYGTICRQLNKSSALVNIVSIN